MSSTSPTPADGQRPRDAEAWARRDTHTLRIENAPTGALNLNVDGRQITSPLQGFGQMWQKTYRVILQQTSITPTQIITAWKLHFDEFWPANSRFFGPLTGIAPGEVALLNIQVSGLPLSTGVLVLYADDESFTLMTPQGHVFAGWITFSSYAEDETTIVQIQVLMRASDPIYEFGLRFMGGHKQEDLFWQHTLGQVARYFGLETGEVVIQTIRVDKKLQWSEAKNIWHNSTMLTTLHTLTRPASWFRRPKKVVQ
ncbi:MAG TPA: hypothetical protein VGD98_24145 [Ktedonobacteraceae bacterium]